MKNVMQDDFFDAEVDFTAQDLHDEFVGDTVLPPPDRLVVTLTGFLAAASLSLAVMFGLPNQMSSSKIDPAALCVTAPPNTATQAWDVGPGDLFDEPQDHLAAGRVLLKLPHIDSLDHLL